MEFPALHSSIQRWMLCSGVREEKKEQTDWKEMNGNLPILTWYELYPEKNIPYSCQKYFQNNNRRLHHGYSIQNKHTKSALLHQIHGNQNEKYATFYKYSQNKQLINRICTKFVAKKLKNANERNTRPNSIRAAPISWIGRFLGSKISNSF